MLKRLMDDSKMTLSDTVFEFLYEGEGGENSDESYHRRPGSGSAGAGDEMGSEEDETSSSAEENKIFWETRNQQLQVALSRTSSIEKKILRSTEDLVKKMRSNGVACTCTNLTARDCRNCALGYITEQLRQAGYNSALCKSKWRRSLDIPSGEHSYVDVMTESKVNGKKSQMKVVIELNFRPEFEMARGSREYNLLVSFLPEVFVGKSEKLRNVVKIMCEAAKQCMKDNKMHMGPWRKHKYMQSKWLGTAPERVGRLWTSAVTAKSPTTAADGERQPKPRASMLTFDLHCSTTAVEVL